MTKDLRFDGRVAIITGAGNGLGRSHALLFGSRGAKVVVNDLGGTAHGGGKSSAAADKVVEEIKAAGGEAIANYDSVEDGDKIVKTALDAWGRVDILVNNAGILRDTSFPKMSQEDWDLIYRVHVLGTFRVTQAAWTHMRDAGFGRIVMTASAAGIYGNFGQANYSMAKLGLVGLANTLALEGRKRNVVVNTIAPIAGSRLTETVMPKELTDALKPEVVSPLVGWLCHEDCQETGGLYEVGGGFFGKLRWERAKGKTFKVGRAVTPEAVKDSFAEISSFAEATHPADITASMSPILANIQAGPSKGGNELIDVDQALGYTWPTEASSYDTKDLALYALSVGAGSDPLDKTDLQLVYEHHADGFRALPTFAVIPALQVMFKLAAEGKSAPGLNYGLDRVLHGEQYTEIKRPLPPHAKLTHKMKVKEIFDKGKGAVVITEIRSFDDAGEELILNEVTTFVRGAGGWGGDRGPVVEAAALPSRAPDAVITEKISPSQALLYRLTGDWNPLHVDPEFAKSFGFPRPILHGLCTFGYAARHVIKAFSGNDPRFFKAIKARFSDSVFPGETLTTEMWKESDGRVVFQCKVQERDKVVISAASIELHKEIPAPKKRDVAAAAAPASVPDGAGGAGGAVQSQDVFGAITHYLGENADLVAKVGTVFNFKLTSPDSAWTIDLKNGKGDVKPGAAEKADVTFELTDADFLGMATGTIDAQKLYFGGKMKISGNVMASQKLSFLQKIDPKIAQGLAKKRGGGAASTPAATPAAATPTSTEGGSGDVFLGIRDYVEKNPELAAKVATVFVFKLTAPDSAWTLDLKNGKGAVTEGAVEKPDVTLELADSDFMAMTSGKADAQKLYFGGKMKITGNVMASQKLDFLTKIDPEAAKKAVAAAKSAGAPKAPAAAPAPTASSSPKTPAIFDALKGRLAKTPGLAAEVAAVLQVNVKSPDAAYVVDLTGPGSVSAGTAKAPAATLSLTEEDLVALAKGSESAQSLYQHGKLRVDGDVRLAHKLGFLKGLV